jgi:hypothetical protein
LIGKIAIAVLDALNIVAADEKLCMLGFVSCISEAYAWGYNPVE